MNKKRMLKRLLWPATLSTLILLTLTVSSSLKVKANDENSGDEARIREGFAIAPVPLNLEGKDVKAVGLGSYLVNAAMGCNECHSDDPRSQ